MDSSFHVIHSIVVNNYRKLHQGEFPSLGFRLKCLHFYPHWHYHWKADMRFTWVNTVASSVNADGPVLNVPQVPELVLFAVAPFYLWFPCVLARTLVLCAYHDASVCNAVANSLWLNHKLRAMWECCQFSTGEGLIHSVSDAINQIKHPSALLEEFLWSTYDSRECQIDLRWTDQTTRDYTAATYNYHFEIIA